MRLASLVGFFSLASLGISTANYRRTPRNYDLNDYYLLHLDDDVSPRQITERLGLQYDGQVGVLDHLHVFYAPKSDGDFVSEARRARKLKRDGQPDVLDSVRFAKKDIPRKPWTKRTIPPPPPGYKPNVAPRAGDGVPDKVSVARQRSVMEALDIRDPTFKDQWHLINTIQPGHDINVTDVWLEGLTGNGTIVAMVDDGLDMDSLDIKDNYYAEGSWDFNDNHAVPKPKLSEDRHGTRCAGEIAAVKNDVCGIGVAYNSRISGLRILSKLITDEDEAVAMTYDYQHNQIYSCSWGPPDDGVSMERPGIPIRQAMLKGVQDGRGGLGSIYVFASGNGASKEDNCNFDGYTNSIYSITVGAVDRAGQHPHYSEKCCAQLVVTYSSGSGDYIHTTDVGKSQCAVGHGGTSAAAPLGAGIMALILQARPELTWRDMQYIVMNTAVPIDLEEAEWTPTAAGRQYSHMFGYGKIDTYSAVQLAKAWDLVKPQSWFFSPWIHVNKDVPQGENGIAVSFEVTADMLKEANLERVEHVTVTMNVNHTRRGDLSADLISPEGFVSHIATTRKLDETEKGYDDWTFMSVAHWGESGIGKWTVIVRDTKRNQNKGFWIDWRLKLWGESIDPAKATKLPMPVLGEDKEHLSTTTISATTSPTTAPTTPAVAQPSSTEPEKPDETAQKAGSTSWVSWLPTFGVSSQAQVWIYGALALIVIFCVGLGIYLFLARRRRLRNASGEDYEFEPLANDVEGYSGGEKGAVAAGTGQGGRRTRGGELYDAFAGGSDDEDEFDAGYKDNQSPSDRSPLNGSDDGRAEEEAQHVIGDDDDSDDDLAPGRSQQNRLLGS